jgi:hypothetical protein
MQRQEGEGPVPQPATAQPRSARKGGAAPPAGDCATQRGGARGRSVSNVGAWRGGEDSLTAGGRLDFLKQRCGCRIAGAAGEGAREGGNAEALGFGICFIYICYWALQLWADGPEMKRGCGETGTGMVYHPAPAIPDGDNFGPD